MSTKNILISLEKKHADNIFSGSKHVELRRRKISIGKDTVVWIYVKKPVGEVVGYAHVVDCYSYAPTTLWKKFSKVSGLDRHEFFKYFEDVSVGFAIALTKVVKLDSPVSLERVREVKPSFQPPQFFMRIVEGEPILNLFNRACSSSKSRSKRSNPKN